MSTKNFIFLHFMLKFDSKFLFENNIKKLSILTQKEFLSVVF